ncbi:hypothetical protein FOL47_001899 [Perkinsus chesapeaki]|uniref:Uncharacterized protein n=1 Tax=Perkinsus chesapeaki TaxID=330153 RepID=A0A7J6MGS9_PERCH|nr:hypothetical protein FOL47_001899 [Perkinsus chesapeaki]
MSLSYFIIGWFIIGAEGDDYRNDGLPSRHMAIPGEFSFPPNCSEASSRGNSTFCATGDYYAVGEQLSLDLDIRLYDARVPNKSVLFGLNVVFDKSVPSRLTVRTGGCAAPASSGLNFLGASWRVTPTICTSGGGSSDFDLSTRGFSANFEVYGDTGIHLDVIRAFLPAVPFRARGHAYANPSFDVGLHATVEDSGGVPNLFEIALNFVNTINSVRNSTKTWRVFSGVSFTVNGTGIGRHSYNTTFIDQIVNLEPFSY